MKAHESTFAFLSTNSDFYEIPFFQRGYVWEESNWSDLYEDLLNENSNHFLGSVIIRKNDTNSGCKYSIIDGQQRLTTISILIRVCYDTFFRYTKEVTENDRRLYDSQMGTMIYHWTQDEQMKSIIKPVIKHSLVDEPNYKKVILDGLTKEDMDKIILDSEMMKQKKTEKSNDNNILKCYKYFYKRIDGNLLICNTLKRMLCENSFNMIVKIDLDENENEQAIFDTINTAGVRLSCADTIKNSIFQKAIENASNEDTKRHIVDMYKKTWEAVFSATEEDINYWNSEIQVGRHKRNNIEILFQSIALILGIYNPEKEQLSMISVCYKNYLTKLVKDSKDNQKSTVDSILSFVAEIVEYARIYKNCFFVPHENSAYRYDDSVERLFHILTSRKITALHPYILKLFKDANVKDRDDVTDKLATQLKRVETYVVRLIVCGETTKNLNKECPILIRGDVSIDDYIKEKNLNDNRFGEGLKSIKENELGRMLLFWIELFNQYQDKKSDKTALYYTFSLEHIMPQTWDEYWGIDEILVRDAETGNIIDDEELAISSRHAAVYELGNMALLSGNLNSAIRNYEFERKINGDPKGKMKKKEGIRAYTKLSTTSEIVKVYDDTGIWDETEIRKRTNRFMQEVIKIWPIEKPV